RAYLQFLYNLRDKYFGNARDVRKVVQEIIKAHDLRLSASEAQLDPQLITLEDVQTLPMDKNELQVNRSSIGFRKG
ncbi:MAG: hypothetical protein AAGJ82_12900, partial [Bacteroidota bacterium]